MAVTVKDEEARTTAYCRCDDRMKATGTQTMRFSAAYGGWVLYDVPTRTMSNAAVFRAFIDRKEYEHTDHRGEPYVWTDCPWCGALLPWCDDQADGAS